MDRKQTVIKPHQLADWYKGIIQLVEEDSYRNALLWHDFFLLLMFTGMRDLWGQGLNYEHRLPHEIHNSSPDTRGSIDLSITHFGRKSLVQLIQI